MLKCVVPTCGWWYRSCLPLWPPGPRTTWPHSSQPHRNKQRSKKPLPRPLSSAISNHLLVGTILLWHHLNLCFAEGSVIRISSPPQSESSPTHPLQRDFPSELTGVSPTPASEVEGWCCLFVSHVPSSLDPPFWSHCHQKQLLYIMSASPLLEALF